MNSNSNTNSINNDKPTVKVAYTDFWRDFKPEHNYMVKLFFREYNLVEDYEDPDIVICSLFGNESLSYDCPRLQIIGEAVSPDFRNYDYTIGFDRMTYPGRYLRMPIYLYHFIEKGTVQKTMEKHTAPDSFYDSRDKFCSFVVSSPKDKTRRSEFFEKLCARKHVDSAGAHLNNMNGKRCEDKIEFLRDYRFNIAFENTIMNGYCTEKITDAFAAGCIPIYYGDPGIYTEFNKGSFINVADFDSFDDCIDYVLYVDEHPDVYESIIRTPAFSENNLFVNNFEEQMLEFFREIVDSGFEVRRQAGLLHYGVDEFNKRPSAKKILVSVSRRIKDRIVDRLK